MKKFAIAQPNFLAFVLLVIFFATCASSVLNKYTTVDESLYIVAGYSYLKTGDFRINMEHPVFVKLLYGLPLLFLDPKLPVGNENWNKSESINIGANYGFASDFYIENLSMFRQIVFSARIVAIILATILGLLIFLWAKEAFGSIAAMLALFLYCFEPNIIAHGSLATLDMPMALFIFASFYFMWKFATSGKSMFLMFSATSISLALLTKHTSLVFVPLLMLFAIANYKQLKRSKKISGKKQFAFWLATILLALVVTPIVFANIFYAFDNYKKSSFVVPARMLDGYSFIKGWSESGREGWFFGEFRSYMPEYYLGAFLIKTTVPMLIFTIIAFLLAIIRRNHDALKIFMPGLIFFILLSLFSRFYIGFRYALPAFPFLFVFIAGAFAPELEKIAKCNKKISAVAIGVLLAWHMLSSVLIYPHYLAYFNELIGGPANGLKYLSDSNIDWGQDFFYFMEFAKARGLENPHLIYFGWPYPTMFMPFHWEPMCEPKEGKFAISATSIIGVTKEQSCHRWLLNYEPKERIGWSIYYYEIKASDLKTH